MFLWWYVAGVSSNSEVPGTVKQNLVSAYKSNLASKLKSEVHEIDDPSQDGLNDKQASRWATTWWQEFFVLLIRGVKERKHNSFSGLKIGQVLVVAFLSGLLWWQSDVSHIQDQVTFRNNSSFSESKFVNWNCIYNLNVEYNADRAPLLLLRILGHLPFIPSYFHFPPRTPNARKGAIFRHVSTLIILHVKDCQWPPDGASPPYYILNHNLLDGRAERQPWKLLSYVVCSLVFCVSSRRSRTGYWCSGVEPKICYHNGIGNHAIVPARWWILCYKCPCLH